MFGSQNDLVSFLASENAGMLTGSGMLRFIGNPIVRAVPECINTYVIFKRDRTYERGFENYKNRQLKRNEKNNNKKDVKHSKKKLPFFHIESLSTKQKFNIFIEKKMSSKDESFKLSSYGLNVSLPYF